MREYQQRVVAEADDLGLKISKLATFIDERSKSYQDIPEFDKELLKLQRYLMNKYHDVLRDRIELFE